MVNVIGCEHKWIVYSTALVQVCLMLECEKCKALGRVDDPSTAEWSAGFYAPSKPYRWYENSRVNIEKEV